MPYVFTKGGESHSHIVMLLILKRVEPSDRIENMSVLRIQYVIILG